MVNTIASVIRHKGSAVWCLSPGASVDEAIELVMEGRGLVGRVGHRAGSHADNSPPRLDHAAARRSAGSPTSADVGRG
jgi:hypothetical protein